jgi:hypothetical protein
VYTPSQRTGLLWKILQATAFTLGLALVLVLFLMPSVGLKLFWNALIPVAPALFVLATGVWRNLCPLATTSLIPDKHDFSLGIRPSAKQRAWLNSGALLLLFGIIPFRHLVFNTSGPATAFLLISVSLLAFLSGYIFLRKSGWCSGLCPLHQVEYLYGGRVITTMTNANCPHCVKCALPCPDWNPKPMAIVAKRNVFAEVNFFLFVGAFPGYIWGWFQVPDFTTTNISGLILHSFMYPVTGALFTVVVFSMLWFSLPGKELVLVNVFSAAAVSCYYWFRLPQLIGFSNEKHTALLDLSLAVPEWVPLLLQIIVPLFFFWWMVLRKKGARSWLYRPAV